MMVLDDTSSTDHTPLQYDGLPGRTKNRPKNDIEYMTFGVSKCFTCKILWNFQ